jgi:AGZA family xanthine/uracil permease-like MFS transporter
MPFAFSITEGISFGFISYAVLMAAAGRAREVHPLLYFFAALFLLRFALLTP